MNDPSQSVLSCTGSRLGRYTQKIARFFLQTGYLSHCVEACKDDRIKMTESDEDCKRYIFFGL